MNDTELVILCIVGIYVVLSIATLWIRDRTFSRPPSTEYDRAAPERFQARLLSPDFEALWEHFKTDMPEPLRVPCGDAQELTSSDFEVLNPNEGDPIHVCFYEPADSQTIGDPWPSCEPFFPFANDGCGNKLLVDPKLPDSPVLFHDHETGELETVAPSMTQFMSWKRMPAAD